MSHSKGSVFVRLKTGWERVKMLAATIGIGVINIWSPRTAGDSAR